MNMNQDGANDSIILTTKDGNAVDISNLSGKRRQELVKAGQLSPDSFIAPANMPGKKLEQMRREYMEQQGLEVAKKEPAFTMDTIKKGQLVSYKGFNTKVDKVLKEEKRVLIHTENGQKKVKATNLDLPIEASTQQEE